MNSKQKVALIFGGQSTEHDVSIVSASSIARALDRGRYEPVYVAIDKQGRWFLGEGAFDLLRGKPHGDANRVILCTDPDRRGFLALEGGVLTAVDVVFPVLHGPRGEDGTLQGMLDMALIPYVGCGTAASAIAMDKDTTKRVLAQAGLPVVKGACVTRWMWDTDRSEVMQEIASSLSGELFIKPATMGSSIGITKAATPEDIEQGLALAFTFSHKVLVEQAVEQALEIEVAILGNNDPQASVAGQVIPGGEYYDFNAKYVDNSSELIIPAKIGKGLSDEIRFMAREAFAAIGGSGLARVDFLVTGTKAYVNEINTLPGFTSISMYPKLWEATGIAYQDLITDLIELALARFDADENLTKTIELEKGLEV
ncbi:MAG: D-alanine--D-alanine ligase family protein [Syntrophaceae bacterium]